MRLAELQKALRAADPGAVLVSPRIMERIIQQACDLRGLTWSVPHWKCYVVDRQTLFRHAEQADLDLEPDQLLPDTVILLARPPAEELSALERKIVLLKYWRRLFHASVHFALEGPKADQRLSPERVRERVEEIGRTEFEEIRTILVQDHYLLPGAGDRETYVEFAAVYLETRFFASSTLPGFFPGIRDFQRIDRMLAQDIDAAALFARTRLVDAPDPVMPVDTRSDESHEQYWALVRTAERANLAGNTVRAAILRTRAWRIAPAALSQGTREEAEADMRRLTARLAAALELTANETAEWGKDLPLLLDKADQGNRPAEARLLEDLQKVCLDHERDIYTLDVVEWLLSAGKRPIKRPLPSLRLVRITRHLHSASQRLGAVRLSDVDRQHLTRLVQAALYKSEESVRARFGPVLTTALQDVGLRPSNPPERTAFAKMVEELLDRIISQGFLTFSDLRDTISRNQLKMPDLKDPEDFIRGDPLLRLDRRLASLLDGVYRPSEIYMRWLERVTALNFGTDIGRTVTRWVTIPFGGAFLLLQVLAVLVHLCFNLRLHPLLHSFYLLLVGPWHHAETPRPEEVAAAVGWLAFPPEQGPLLAVTAVAAGQAAAPPNPHPAFHFLLLLAVGFFLVALLHVERFRRRCRRAARAVGRALHEALIALPVRLIRMTSLQRLWSSWPFQLFWWYLFKPLVVGALIWFWLPQAWHTAVAAAVVFLATAFLLNSRLGHAAAEGVVQAVGSFADLVRAGLLPGLYRLIVRVFKEVIDTVELVLFTVDDWLRFRSGDTRRSLVLRTVLGLLWFPVSYLARFYMVVLIEPGFNPIKAPVSYLAAKVMLPIIGPLTTFIVGLVDPALGWFMAWLIAVPTVWLLPDAFGFLFWETKENWSLYRANRRQTLQPVAVGPHGETVKALLQPGFHSGTVPRLYQRLRQAEREAYRTRNWAGARACRHELEEVSRSLERFVSRELVAVLRQSASWQDQRLSVGRVDLAVNRIGIELVHAAHLSRPVEIEFELRAGWLVAGVCDPGWLDQLGANQLRAFTTALASLYKLAGIDLVREQIQANLPAGAVSWDVTAEGLTVRTDRLAPSALYDLREPVATGQPRSPEGGAPSGLPAVDLRLLVFARSPLSWQQWLESWQKERDGQGHPGLGGLDRELVRPWPVQVAAASAPVPEASPDGRTGIIVPPA